MKLRNLMYATMIACAFASCSKDEVDVPGTDGPGTKGDATLAVKFNVAAKTTEASGKTDKTISNLRVYVFNGDATYQTQGEATDAQAVINIAVKPGAAKVVAVANYSDNYTPTNVADLYAKVKDWNSEKDGSLTMNSQTYDVSIVGGTTNYLGYTEEEANSGNYLGNESGNPVKMYRNVAKVKLASIKADPDNKTQYSNATFKIEDVFILHGSAQTKLVGGATKWAETYVPAVSDVWVNASGYDYAAWVTTMTNKDKKQNYVTTAPTFKTESLYVGTDLPTSVVNSTPELNVDSFYVYENTQVGVDDINTLLVVKGKFLYDGVDESKAPSTFYSVAVGKDGVSGGTVTPPAGASARSTAMTGVLRNMQYDIALTVKTPGYETPFGPVIDEKLTVLDVKVEVVAWGHVNQEVGI